MKNQYCGYIEVFSGVMGTHRMKLPQPMFFLKYELKGTLETPNLKTVAIFKIKLK